MSNPSLILPQSPAYAVSNVYAAQVYDGEVPVYDVLPLTFTRASNGSRINTNGLVQQMGTNIPRVTYPVGGGCGALLLEKQSTNYVTYSEQFDNVSWTDAINGGTLITTANYGISPDGTQNADRLQMSIGGGGSYSQKYKTLGANISQVYTWSVWLKSLSGTPTIGIGYNGTNWNVATLTTEWVRYTFSVAATSTSINADIILYNVIPTSTNADFLVWGYQIESSTYATSYISTTSSSATRIADVCYKTGISNLIGQTEGTMFVDVDLTHSNESGANQYLMQLYLDAGARVILFRNSASQLNYYFLKGSTTFYSSTSISSNGRHKLAFAYKSGNSAFYIDGVQIDINATTFSAFSSLSELHIAANFNPTQAEIGDYNYNQAIIYKTRLTNAELATLTTL